MNNSEEIYQLILAHMPPCEWIQWAAFDKPNEIGCCKLSFYEHKPEIRSDFWFAKSGRIQSIINLHMRSIDWTGSLCKVKYNIKACETERAKLIIDIEKLENELRSKKSRLYELMRRCNEPLNIEINGEIA